MLIKYFTICALCAIGFLGMSRVAAEANSYEMHKAELASCPSSPNCVSSLADARSCAVIEPIQQGSHEEPLQKIMQIMRTLPRTEVLREEKGFVHMTVRSAFFRFVDDVYFLHDPENRLIHVKSAARSGFYDFGVNRRRIEKIRKVYK